MENRQFIIDDGTKEYEFKNMHGRTFAVMHINALDTGIISRYKNMEKVFETIEFTDDMTDDEVVELDNKMIKAFSDLLNMDVSKDLFGVYTPFTVFKSGDFYAEVIFEKLGEIISEEFNIRLEEKKAKIKKATKKYIH